ncbi:hypothetical protein GUITHDRAFT_163721 [Guillardia theta CCMP2712]|uniref:Uncharacterized protein n=2 Tax=Guillardia theta TaxID=55529 RepID=L1J670_GUITC|nr:hypothetical protein GUITHDRAFT_163721 [Guillardia theta CCMP2712]EKX44038.1 hypothetical protein GUITHDRAFT_163721 [Guillardia theta CCMP2712]|eukprot:XP_005831018.1 hypothetical protein GUITHDRAFT_163721 [Guillardia theta CCMP2712]
MVETCLACRTGREYNMPSDGKCRVGDCKMPCQCTPSTAAMIYGSVIGGVLLVVVIFCCCFYARRRANNNVPQAMMVQYPPQQQVIMQNGVPIPMATPVEGYPGNQRAMYPQQQNNNRRALGMGLAGGLLGGWALGSMMDGGADYGGDCGGDFGGGDGGF